MIHNQNKEEGKCCPISFQNKKNSKIASCPNLNQLPNDLHVQTHSIYLSNPYVTYIYPLTIMLEKKYKINYLGQGWKRLKKKKLT
jgi:hypothetical protein